MAQLATDGASSAITLPHPIVVVGLDFGTWATGFAYCEVAGARGGGYGDPRVKLHLSWPDQPTADPKTRTAVLYKGSQLEAWGWTAWRRWLSMTQEERAAGRCTYLEEFKLLLEDGSGSGSGRNLGSARPRSGGDGDSSNNSDADTNIGLDFGSSVQRIQTTLRRSLPPGLTAVHVVTDFLGAVRRYILAHLAVQPLPPGFHADRVAWCLTIPAMWSDAAKDKMRRAALRAGYIRTATSSSLMLTVEPEAAALCAVLMGGAGPGPESSGGGDSFAETTSRDSLGAAADRIEPTPPSSASAASASSASSASAAASAAAVGWSPREPSAASSLLVTGDVLLVLDCGGGTADVTIHRVVAAGRAAHKGQEAGAAAAESPAAGGRVRLREAAVGAGALAGGCLVDAALWSCLREMLGADPWDTWINKYPADWTQLRDTWEQEKRFFVGAPPLPKLLRPAAGRSPAAPPRPVTSTVAALSEEVSQWRLFEVAPHPGGPEDFPTGGEAENAAGDCRAEDDDEWLVPFDGKYGISLRLPQSLVKMLPDQARQELEGSGGVAALTHGSSTAATGTRRPWLVLSAVLPRLVLPGEFLERAVFGPPVDLIVDLAREVAEEARSNGVPATKVLLAGGFAGSPYLQRRIRTEVAGALGPAPLPLLLPQYPAAAVLTGAVLYGRDPLSMASRAVRLSYGLEATAPWSAVHERSYAARGYPNRVHNPEDDSYFADKVFTPFVVRGQLVEAEEVVERFFAPLHKSQPDIYFELYGTHARDASYLDEPGMRLLGKAVLQLPTDWDQCDEVRREGTWGYIVQAELRFGATEITLTARNPRTNEVVATSVDWSSDVADAVRGQ